MRVLIALASFATALPAFAHGGERNASSFEPWIAACVVAAAALYAVGLTRLWRRAGRGRGVSIDRALLYAAGLAVLAVSLMGPLDTWSATSFAVHMVQHEALMLVAAPILAASRPLGVFAWAFSAGGRGRLRRLTASPVVRYPWTVLTSPVGATALQLAVLWLWHAPRLFDLAVDDGVVHAFQHASFLPAALCFWWALRARRGGDPAAGRTVVCLFVTMIGTGALGALLAFSVTPWYSAYANAQSVLGLTALEDQQVGGLLMWIPGGAVFLVVALSRMRRVLAPANPAAARATARARMVT